MKMRLGLLKVTTLDQDVSRHLQLCGALTLGRDLRAVEALVAALWLWTIITPVMLNECNTTIPQNDSSWLIIFDTFFILFLIVRCFSHLSNTFYRLWGRFTHLAASTALKICFLLDFSTWIKLGKGSTKEMVRFKKKSQTGALPPFGWDGAAFFPRMCWDGWAGWLWAGLGPARQGVHPLFKYVSPQHVYLFNFIPRFCVKCL